MVDHPFATKISKEEINALPRIQFEGTIHLIDTPEQLEPAIQQLSQASYVGFDTETRPAFQKGVFHAVSLLQLSTAEEAFLFRLNMIHFPQSLKALLEKEDLLKLGVAMHDDIRALQKLSSFQPQGFLDFAQIAKKLGLKNSGLRSLVGIILGFRISKSARLSNWDQKDLTPPQLNYAATDAWICYEIYRRLLETGVPEELLLDASNGPILKKENSRIEDHQAQGEEE